MGECLDDDAIAAYVDGALQPTDLVRIEQHIDECVACRTDLSAMAIAHGSDAALGESAAMGELQPGDTIGRYVVIHEHARGGMGVVAVAHDPELGRKVAIKVLRDDVDGGGELLRAEARAMASLSHANVVAVHDVGSHGGRLFLAMELVDGASLRSWIAVQRRSWRAIVGTLIAAGRGLAAAHRAGIVHRDFKPDNILCGPAERVRVTDFGLARHDGIARGSHRTGVAGTPRYIAPEVWRGVPATPQSDQWSFCATLYEALYGAPPFDGATLREIGDAIQRGAPAIPQRPRVPARVTRALARGLRGDPDERFPSLDALLAELTRALRRQLAPFVLAGAALVAAIIAVTLASVEQPPLCEMPASLLDGTWDATSHAALASALPTSGRSHASTTARRVTEILDGYAADWLAARSDACVATRVRGDHSDAVLDARTRCLDRRRIELAALVHELVQHPTAEVVDRAVQAAHELPSIDSCSALGVASDHPLPVAPDRAALVVALDHELAEIRASELVARVDRLEVQARSIVERAKPLGYPPLVARASGLLAKLATYSSDHASAEHRFAEALDAAATAHDDRLAAKVWIDLVSWCAMQKGDPALALTHARTAEVAVLRADSPRELRAAFLHARGIAYATRGKFAEARDDFVRALAEAPGTLEAAVTGGALCNVELRLGKVAEASERCWSAARALEAELGPNHPTVGFQLLNAGNVAMQTRDHRRARDALVRAISILGDTVGERHIAYGLALNNLGMIEERTDDVVGARRDYGRALAVLDAKKHPDAFLPRLNLGNLARQAGNVAEARRYWQEALAIAEGTHGKVSERVALIIQSLGGLEVDVGNLDAAERDYRRALAITLELFGENHPQTADALDGLGFVYAGREDCKRAMTYQRRAAAVNEAIYGPDAPRLAEVLTTLADCQARTGDRAALANLERALAIHDRQREAAAFEPAATRWIFAQALDRFGGDRARAIRLATEARALYASSHEQHAAKTLPEIDRWLAKRRR